MSDLLERLRAALSDRYDVEREVGRGGMAIVFLAQDIRLGRPVAIKVLRPDIATSIGSDRFLREISVEARLTHPNILPLHDSGDADGLLFYVMPYVEGESLADRLRRETQLSVDDAIHIAVQVAGALAYAHDHGIVHRDIKPENILLVGQNALVADFGIARAFESGDARLTETGLVVGTPQYMSPEQSTGQYMVDGRSDIYSLGCVLYEMLIGEPPFTGPTVSVVLARHAVEQVPQIHAIRRTVSEAVDRAVQRAMEKTPADRFAKAEQFAEALIRGDTAPSGARIQRMSLFRAPVLRNALAAGVGAIALAVVAFVGIRAIRPTPPAAALDPNLVAVMPFRVRGTLDAELTDLSEGLAELLYVRLPGEGGPRAVSPAAITSGLGERSRLDDAPLDVAIGIARNLGAGRLLIGQLWSVAGELVLSAAVHSVPDGAEVTRIERVSGPSDSLLSLVDRLAAELITRSAGEDGRRLSELVSTDLTALRAYLAGKAAFARGEYETSVRSFEEALRIDSTFALAGLGLAAAGMFYSGEGLDDAVDQGIALAWAASDRLAPRDRAYLDAMAGPRYPASSSYREHLAAWEGAVLAAPDRSDAWHQLAEALLHWGPWIGKADSRERASAAFQRALDLDSSLAPAVGHLLDLAAAEGDTAAVRRLGARYFALDSIGDLAEYYRWRTAVALGDSASLLQLRARFDELNQAVLERVSAVAQLDGLDMRDAVSATDAWLKKEGSGGAVRWTLRKHAELALNRGRPAEALGYSVRAGPARGVNPRDALTSVVEALYWQADSATAAQLVAERAAGADQASGEDRDAGSPLHYDVCAVNLWRLAHGDLTTVRRAIRHLQQIRSPYQSFGTGHSGVCAALLDAELAHALGRPDAALLLDRLDSLAASGPPSTSWMLVAANLAVARLKQAAGDLEGALAAVRRRSYQYDMWEPRVLVGLSTFLREEGRLAALVGDRDAAVRAYTHYLALRDDPEPSVAPEVARVRDELAQLVAEQGGGP